MGATGASDMMISNNSDFSGASWETYATSKSWALTTGDGTKTVYAKFKSSTGDVSSIVSDSITLTTSLIAPSPPSQQNAQQMAGQYDYQFVSESAFPTLLNSATVDMTITLKNTGTATWSNTGANPVRLGTNRPMDRNCGFKTDTGWLSTNRIAMDQATVAPNANATFTFKVAKNSIPQGAYREYFRPVVENINWMKDIGIYWEIKVISPANQYDYEFISQSAYPQIAVGGTSGLWLRLKNTGTATWDQSTVRLGTAKPLDRTSAFFDTDAASYPNPKWVTQNRIRMEQTTVAPGENADFVFYVKVPASAKAGTYKEYFRPVVENIGWLRDIGIYWSIKVK